MGDIDLSIVGTRLGDTSALPPELLAQLVIKKQRPFEARILALLIYEFSGAATATEIVVALWRQRQRIYTKPYIQNVLSRMKQSGLISPVDGYRGAYRIVTGATQ